MRQLKLIIDFQESETSILWHLRLNALASAAQNRLSIKGSKDLQEYTRIPKNWGTPALRMIVIARAGSRPGSIMSA